MVVNPITVNYLAASYMLVCGSAFRLSKSPDIKLTIWFVGGWILVCFSAHRFQLVVFFLSTASLVLLTHLESQDV